MLKAVFIICFLLFGGFYDWSVAFIGVALCICTLLLYCRKNGIYKKEEKAIYWIPEIIFVFEIIVSFWAIDFIENIAGVMRGTVILLWMNMCLQQDSDNKEYIIFMIPEMGVFAVCMGIITYWLEKLKVIFWSAERLGGIFQYANTFAVFLLLGIIVYLHRLVAKIKKEQSWRKLSEVGKGIILVVGILLTGSRSVLILGIVCGCFHCISNKTFRKPFIYFITSLGSLLGVFYIFTGNGQQNISRIFTIINSNSTLYGRLLYYVDGISILLKYPLGLGYMGYFYIQHALQTGVYTVRFIHNDILQMGIDYGIIPLILFSIFFMWQLLKGKQSKLLKELFAVITIASFVDFHMQYLIIDFIIVLCLDMGERTVKPKRKEKTENMIFLVLLAVCFTYFCVPYLAIYKGLYQVGLYFMPNNTNALCMAMSNTRDKNDAVTYANHIIKQNEYVSESYRVKAYAAAMDGDIDLMIENMDMVLRLEKYDVGRYRAYDLLLLEHIKQLKNKNDKMYAPMINMLGEKRIEIREHLIGLSEETNPIAYKLRDVPQYTW